MPKKPFYQQNDGHLSYDPPKHLEPLAKECWRKVVPFLEETKRVKRIDSMLVESYCTQYQEYRDAYKTLIDEGAQRKVYRSLQNSEGKIIGKDFTGWKQNPAVGRLKEATKNMSTLGIQLGLSPKSREELFKTVQSSESKKSATDKMKDFFGGDK